METVGIWTERKNSLSQPKTGGVDDEGDGSGGGGGIACAVLHLSSFLYFFASSAAS